MNQSSFAAPQNVPEPWNSSSTDSRFSGEFLLQKLRQLHEWVGTHSAPLSALLGMVGIVLIGVTWLEFQATIEQLQINSAVVTTAEVAPTPSIVTISTPGSSKLRAHIAGAVRKPGVYEMTSPSVVQDLVLAAGGLSGLVWQDYLDEYINLAAPLVPNQKIWIPSLAQRELLEQVDTVVSSTTDSVNLPEVPVVTKSAQLSINTATVFELDTLAGIGQKRAEDIVSNRPYAVIDELTSKAGVPASIVSELKNQLKI